MRHIEEDIQSACIQWFDLQFPAFRNILYAIPNGGKRNIREAARLKKNGVRAGISDLILLRSNGVYNSLCIEMKAPGGKQTEKQKEWQRLAEHNGNKYVVCHSLDEFMSEVNEYIKQK